MSPGQNKVSFNCKLWAILISVYGRQTCWEFYPFWHLDWLSQQFREKYLVGFSLCCELIEWVKPKLFFLTKKIFFVTRRIFLWQKMEVVWVNAKQNLLSFIISSPEELILGYCCRNGCVSDMPELQLKKPFGIKLAILCLIKKCRKAE